MLPDIASTGIAGAESGQVRVGDSVAVFAQGPIGLCATVGARLRGAGLIIGVDPLAGSRGPRTSLAPRSRSIPPPTTSSRRSSG